MVYLEDKINIHASLEEVKKFLVRMPENYKSWHPKDHIEFRSLQGEKELREGSLVHATERLGRFTLSAWFRVVTIGSHKVIWRSMFPFSLVNLHGEFLAEERQGIIEFTSTNYYGWTIPFFGGLLDWVISSFFMSREELAKHIREEGENLKAVVESHRNV